jgi:hypothetical protein
MAGNTFQKFKSSVNRGITTISVKTSSSLEKSKIKTHIDTINREIQRKISIVGEDAYNIWLGNNEDFSSLYETFEEIKNKYNEIEELNEQLVYIDQRDNEILGTAVKENAPKTEVIAAEEPVVTEDSSVENVQEPKVEESEAAVEEKVEAEEQKEEQPKRRFCRNCGTPYEGQVKFCRNCGTQMNP